jgi:hypothetical protein
MSGSVARGRHNPSGRKDSGAIEHNLGGGGFDMKVKFFFVSMMAAALMLGGVALSIAAEYKCRPLCMMEEPTERGYPSL